MARRVTSGWSSPTPVSFNSPGRDFDPAFSADGRFVYFCSDRSGGIGKDDLYRVAVMRAGFGSPEKLGPRAKTAEDALGPMLYTDRRVLALYDHRSVGDGGHEL